jgi:uncharacterized protein (DUF1697 family)
VPARVLMLRGINVGGSRRVPMADLRALLGEAGYEDVRTYVQSGNVVLSSSVSAARLARDAQELISARFGFEVPVIVRTREALAKVVALDPLGDVVDEPKRYQVTFLSAPLAGDVLARLEKAAVDDERVVAHGHELYTWHPAGVARSKMWTAIAGTGLGVTATARNWRTVTTLLEMAGGA